METSQKISTSTSFMGREDGRHMEKDRELASLREQVRVLEHERHKAAEYAKAAYRDHRRERTALYNIEQACKGARLNAGHTYLYPIEEVAREALRDYYPDQHGS